MHPDRVRRLLRRRFGLHLARHGVEGAAQLVAQALHCGDRGDGDQCGDQAVFDRGGALAVLQERADGLHGKFSRSLLCFSYPATGLRPPSHHRYRTQALLKIK